MLRAIKILTWFVTAALAVSATGYVMMAIDGYDYWSPLFPPPQSLAETGFDLAWIGQLLGLVLMAATWILLSIWLTKIRDSIPTTWKHDKASIWLWWFVPVAWFWKPRDVYMEIALAARPGATGATRRMVDRWWISAVLFLIATYLGWFEFGPAYLAFAACGVAVTAGLAAFSLGVLLTWIKDPELTFASAVSGDSAIEPSIGPEPTVPGWYNDPTGHSNHQAYWDGGRFTGAIRSDPRAFPSLEPPVAKAKDPLKVWLIVIGTVATIVLIAYTIGTSIVAYEEDPGGFDIARIISSL